MHGGKACGFENAWKDDQQEDMSPANDFPKKILISMSTAIKIVAQNVTLCRNRTLFYLRIRNNSMQKFFEFHETNAWGASSIRVQPEPQGCSWSVRDLQEKPRGGSRGAVTRILSGR
jgi:hypothetical protein